MSEFPQSDCSAPHPPRPGQGSPAQGPATSETRPPMVGEKRPSPGAWVYEIAMGATQGFFGLSLLILGLDLASGYGSPMRLGSDSVFIQMFFVFMGIGFLVAGVARPFRLK